MSSISYTEIMLTRHCLVPGFLTHIELDPLLGSTRTRERWEVRGALPRGRWIKGFGRRMGIYPEVVLAHVVAGRSPGRSEDALNLLTIRSQALLRSELLGEIEDALRGIIGDLEHIGLSFEVLDCLAERQLLTPLQDEMRTLADEVWDAGIGFEGTVGRLTRKAGGMIVVENDDERLSLTEESIVGFVEDGGTVAVERVRVGAREHDFVLPSLASTVPSRNDSQWDEMFASFTGRPVSIPVLAGDYAADMVGGEPARRPRRLNIRVPRELYAGANPMIRASAFTEPA